MLDETLSENVGDVNNQNRFQQRGCRLIFSHYNTCEEADPASLKIASCQTEFALGQSGCWEFW